MHFKRIDQLRGFAALAVVSCHFAVSAESVVTDATHQPWYWVAGLLGWGYLGVPLFFVISGLCIHLPAASAIAETGTVQSDWRRFFQRRFWRLYPPYLAALVVAAALLLLVNHELPVGWHGILAQALLVHTFHPATFDGLNPPAWTLAVEAQLYLAYPIVLALFLRFGAWRGLAAVLAVTMLYRVSLNFGIAPPPLGAVAWEVFLARWFEWTLGAFIASWAVGSVSVPALARRWWVAGAALALAVRFEWETWHDGLYALKEPLYGVAFALVVLVALDRERSRGRVSTTRIGRYLGEVGVYSYSLYLVHRPIQLAFEPLVRRIATTGAIGGHAMAASIVLMAATTPVVLRAGRLFHRYCEAPCVEIAKRVGRTRPRLEEPTPAPAMKTA